MSQSNSRRTLKRIAEKINIAILAWAGDNPKRKTYKMGVRGGDATAIL